jgi:hypothetical protein
MIGLLQRLGHREVVLGFLGWSLLAVVVMYFAASLLAIGAVASAAGSVAVAAVSAVAGAVFALGVVMGRRVSRRGTGLAIAVVVMNALPLAIAGTVVTTFTAEWGWPLLAAPILLTAGSGIGIVSRRRSVGYQNPGSMAVGAGSALAVCTMGVWFALGTMDALLGQGIVLIQVQLVEYGCLDPPRARLAAAIRSLGSQYNRDRLERAFQNYPSRPCDD